MATAIEAKSSTVNLDMFDPSKGREVVMDTLTPMFGSFTLRGYLRAQERMRENSLDPDYFSRTNGSSPKGEPLLRRLDRNFYHALEENYDRDGLATGEAFYARLLEAAHNFTTYVRKTLFEGMGDMVRPRNEVALQSSRPSDLLKRIAGNGVGSRLQYESTNQAVEALLAADFLAKSYNSDLHNRLYELHEVFDKRLFAGQMGEAQTRVTYALYEDDTNRIVGLHGRISSETLDPTKEYHWKKHYQQSREIPGVGYAMVEITPKDITSAMAKALRRAVDRKNKGGSIDVDPTDVHDIMRMRIVVEDTDSLDDPAIQATIDKVTAALQHFREVESITPDDSVNNHASKSNEFGMRRLRVKFKGIAELTEIMFFDEKGYLNSEFGIGTYDEGKNKFTGAAHSLYGVHRLVELIPLLYPNQVKGYGDIDLKELAKRRLLQEANKLRQEARVDDTTQQMLNAANNIHTNNE